jgi:NAD(P)-dependent dehydrogenase (short-subunit alcohol dehydrogenase family)
MSPAWIEPVSRIFITGSADGLGRAAAGALMAEGHDVVLHARTRKRAAARRASDPGYGLRTILPRVWRRSSSVYASRTCVSG